MTADEFTEKLIRSFRRYYDICTDGINQPYSATAEFHSHDSRYFLTRKAVIGESESHEYVYFHKSAVITAEDVRTLSASTWKTGLKNVKPHKNHRNTDITLIMAGNRAGDDALKAARKIRYYRKYSMTFKGWSHFRLAVIDTESGKTGYNGFGRSLKNTVNNILYKKEKS